MVSIQIKLMESVADILVRLDSGDSAHWFVRQWVSHHAATIVQTNENRSWGHRGEGGLASA
jgi:uncharacterized protein (DUF305 family)